MSTQATSDSGCAFVRSFEEKHDLVKNLFILWRDGIEYHDFTGLVTELNRQECLDGIIRPANLLHERTNFYTSLTKAIRIARTTYRDQQILW
jgi:hypothetical protein